MAAEAERRRGKIRRKKEETVADAEDCARPTCRPDEAGDRRAKERDPASLSKPKKKRRKQNERIGACGITHKPR